MRESRLRGETSVLYCSVGESFWPVTNQCRIRKIAADETPWELPLPGGIGKCSSFGIT